MSSPWSILHALRARSTEHPRSEWTRLICALADHQHGVVAAWQLVGLGISRSAIERRLRSGMLGRIRPGVYAVARRRLSPRGRWSAAVLASGPGAVLSHRAAGSLWGLGEHASAAVAVTVRSKRAPGAAIRAHRSPLPADERAVRDGIPVTSVPRAILDLSATEPAQRIERMIDRAESDHHHDRLSLPDLLERYPRRHGSPRLRAVLAARAGLTVTRSELEERFLALLRQRELERPQLNVPVRVGTIAYEVDCLWPARGLAVELDGYADHGGRRAFREDRVRDRRLRTVGIETVRVTWHDIVAGADALERDLRRIGL